MNRRRKRSKQGVAEGIEPWLSVEEIAEHIGVSKDTIYNWIKKDMPSHKIGKLWKFKASQVDKWAESGKASDDNE